MLLYHNVKKNDETKPDSDEGNLEVEIFADGGGLCDESSVEDIEKLKHFIKGLHSGRIKTKPIA